MIGKIGLALIIVGTGLTAGSTTAAAQKKDRYLITVEEIKEREDISTAHDAVRLLRPQWLKTARSKGSLGSAAFGSAASRPAGRNNGSEDNPTGSIDEASRTANATRDRMMADDANKQSGPVAYVDDVKQESVEDLKNIRVAEVAEIRYMSGNDASGRYGAGHESGAILLKTNRLKKP